MSQIQKILLNILSGTKDTNISFSDLQKILTLLGFVVRIKGDHFIYTKDGIDEIINIQRYGGGSTAVRYDLRAEKANKMHDDRAYCFAMLGWYLHQKRRNRLINKKPEKKNPNNLTMCVSQLNF